MVARHEVMGIVSDPQPNERAAAAGTHLCSG